MFLSCLVTTLLFVHGLWYGHVEPSVVCKDNFDAPRVVENAFDIAHNDQNLPVVAVKSQHYDNGLQILRHEAVTSVLQSAQYRPVDEEVIATPLVENRELTRQSRLVRRLVRRKTLNAVYHVNCPVGGARFMTFRWSIVYNTDRDNLYGVRLENIDAFVGLTYYDTRRPRYFKSAFRRQICLDFGCTTCTYKFRGHFEGGIHREGISMTFINIGDDPTRARAPWVTESCVHHGLHTGHNICPIISWNFCEISSIDVVSPDTGREPMTATRR